MTCWVRTTTKKRWKTTRTDRVERRTSCKAAFGRPFFVRRHCAQQSGDDRYATSCGCAEVVRGAVDERTAEWNRAFFFAQNRVCTSQKRCHGVKKNCWRWPGVGIAPVPPPT